MHVGILGAESLGVRGLSCVVEVEDHKKESLREVLGRELLNAEEQQDGPLPFRHLYHMGSGTADLER